MSTSNQAPDWRPFLNTLAYGNPTPAAGAEDVFVGEGREAFRQGAERADCPHDEGTDGEFGWRRGYDLEAEQSRRSNGKPSEIDVTEQGADASAPRLAH